MQVQPSSFYLLFAPHFDNVIDPQGIAETSIRIEQSDFRSQELRLDISQWVEGRGQVVVQCCGDLRHLHTEHLVSECSPCRNTVKS